MIPQIVKNSSFQKSAVQFYQWMPYITPPLLTEHSRKKHSPQEKMKNHLKRANGQPKEKYSNLQNNYK